MNTRLRYNEDLIRDSAANLQRGIETVGGWLYLTTHRLIFEAHAFNVQAGATIIPLRDVREVWKCWTRLLGLVPVFPNSVAVSTARGKTYRFVIGGRDGWITIIRETKQDLEERAEEDEDEDEDD